MAEDRTPVALFEVSKMKSIFIFLSVSILELLAVKRSAEGKFNSFPCVRPIAFKTKCSSHLLAQYVFLHGCAVSCMEFCKSRFKSDSHEPYMFN